MKIKPLTLLNVVLAICLVSALLFTSGTMTSRSEDEDYTAKAGEYDPWVDYNDDGRIDHKDLFQLAAVYGTSGTPINKTALLLDLLARVEALENQTLPQGFIGAPAYDSGWLNISQGESILLTHNLGTKEFFVFVTGKDSLGRPHHFMYGSVEWSGGLWGGVYWYIPDNIHIVVTRLPHDNLWIKVRVMIWKIQ